VPGPFDRFNDRAKRVLALAQDEAIRFNHNYIGVEHLLLGLVREGEGVAARALESLGVELSKVRTAVEFLVGRGDTTISPSEITLSPRTKKVIELAGDEARKLGHGHVGTEHLLLGLVREGDGVASGVLESLGVSLARVRHQVIATFGQTVPPEVIATIGHAAPSEGARPDDPVQRVIAIAQNEALGLGHSWVGTEHLVLGLIGANGTKAQQVLVSLGVTAELAREHVAKLSPPPAEWKTTELTMSPLAQTLLERRGRGRDARHLLYAIVTADSQGARLLVALGVSLEKVRAQLDERTE
jgi:ATP-dependent Clp protease ATP-binding subunit ClpA